MSGAFSCRVRGWLLLSLLAAGNACSGGETTAQGVNSTTGGSGAEAGTGGNGATSGSGGSAGGAATGGSAAGGGAAATGGVSSTGGTSSTGGAGVTPGDPCDGDCLVGTVHRCFGDCPLGVCDNDGVVADTPCSMFYPPKLDANTIYCRAGQSGSYCLATVNDALWHSAVTCSDGTPAITSCEVGCGVNAMKVAKCSN